MPFSTESRYARYYVTGGAFPVGLNSLCLNSPCYLLVKPGVLAACIAPHRYLSGAAISSPACIHRTLRPNDSSPTCIGEGIFHPFHQHASWRTRLSLSSNARCSYSLHSLLRLCLDIDLFGGGLEVFKERRAKPSLGIIVRREIPIPPGLLPPPYKLGCIIGKRGS
jgi:hypothetical protein